MAPYGLSWPCMSLYGPVWPRFVSYGPIWSCVVLYGSVRSCITSYGPFVSLCYKYLPPLSVCNLLAVSGVSSHILMLWEAKFLSWFILLCLFYNFIKNQFTTVFFRDALLVQPLSVIPFPAVVHIHHSWSPVLGSAFLNFLVHCKSGLPLKIIHRY